MKIFECKCGSTEVFIEQSGNNTGLYCAECGKWITWLNKDQLRLAKRQIDNHDKQIREDTIDEFVKAIEKHQTRQDSYLDTPYVEMGLDMTDVLEVAKKLKEQNK